MANCQKGADEVQLQLRPERRRIEHQQRLEGAAADSGDDDVEPSGQVVCGLQRRRQFRFIAGIADAQLDMRLGDLLQQRRPCLVQRVAPAAPRASGRRRRA